MADICQYWWCSGRIQSKRQHIQARPGRIELNLMETMKTPNPPILYKVIKENVLLHGNLPTENDLEAVKPG